MGRYELIIFDLDGTLLNTKKGILAAVEYTIKEWGLRPLTEGQEDNFIGPPIQNSFAKEYGIEGDDLQKIAEIFRDRYKYHDLLKAEHYDGITDILEKLRKEGLKLAVATYKREDYAFKILQEFGLFDYFDVVHGADNNNVLKKSDIIEMCVKEAGVTDRKRILLIGDTLNDEIGAKKSEIDFLGVLYGFGYKDKRERTDYPVGFAATPYEILKYVI